MEQLIEEYKVLGLNDGQAITAITKGVSPKQIKRFRVLVIEFQKSMEEVAQTIINAFENNKEFIKSIEDMRAKEFEEHYIKKRS